MSITAAMFVYNEEKWIENILRCVQWCDEILVFDRKSEDATQEIAKRFSARIIEILSREYTPSDNFVILKEVKTKWMLGLTASDLISPGLSKNILKLIDQPDFPFDEFSIEHINYFTPRSLATLTVKYGLIPKKIQTIPQTFLTRI
jgi:glycosyltransferase involved in cell wall biosynthesis